MSVTNGQNADETTFNTAFVSRSADTSASGKIDLENADTTDLIDVQRVVNEIADQSGIANQAATDATAKTYSSNNVVANGDDQKTAVGKLDGEFDTSTGHDHDGVNSKAISADALGDFNNLWSDYVEETFTGAAGTSDDVSADFAAKTSGGDANTAGVITDPPNNLVSIVVSSDNSEVEDGSGRRVFGRLTEAAGTWTLSYFVNISGVETAHSLTSTDIRYFYREVFAGSDRPTIGANVGVFDSLQATQDIIDASSTQAGKVSTGAQDFAGIKNFVSRPTIASVDVVDISSSQVITNKDVDGSASSASDTNRIVVPNETTTNLNLLTNKLGSIAIDTTLSSPVWNNGSAWTAFGGGGGGFAEPAIFKDVLPTGSFGRNSTAGSFQTRVLNTTEGDTSFSSLSSNQIRLTNAGDYFIIAICNAYRSSSHVSLLYNVTDAANEIIGTDEFSAFSTNQVQTHSFIVGSFTTDGANEDFEIRTRVGATATGGHGVGAGFGVDEVYTTVMIWEL